MTTKQTTTGDDAQLLTRVLEPGKPLLTKSAAQSILSMKFPDKDLTRMKLLADRARQGILSKHEELEIDSYARVSSLLAILQIKARETLKPKTSKAGRV